MAFEAKQTDCPYSKSNRLLDAVVAAYAAKDFQRVLGLCAAAIVDDTEWQFDLYCASAYYELGFYDDSILALDRYAFASGDDCHAPVERLKLLYLAKRWDEVVESGQKILNDAMWFVSPSELPEIRLMVGIAFAEIGDLLGAWRALGEDIRNEDGLTHEISNVRHFIRSLSFDSCPSSMPTLYRPNPRFVPSL